MLCVFIPTPAAGGLQKRKAPSFKPNKGTSDVQPACLDTVRRQGTQSRSRSTDAFREAIHGKTRTTEKNESWRKLASLNNTSPAGVAPISSDPFLDGKQDRSLYRRCRWPPTPSCLSLKDLSQARSCRRFLWPRRPPVRPSRPLKPSEAAAAAAAAFAESLPPPYPQMRDDYCCPVLPWVHRGAPVGVEVDVDAEESKAPPLERAGCFPLLRLARASQDVPFLRYPAAAASAASAAAPDKGLFGAAREVPLRPRDGHWMTRGGSRV